MTNDVLNDDEPNDFLIPAAAAVRVEPTVESLEVEVPVIVTPTAPVQ